MKKLKNKIFWTIYLILTCFLISILSIFQYQEYMMEKRNIQSNLTRIHDNGLGNNNLLPNEDLKTDNIDNLDTPENNSKDETTPQKIFMDSVVYTVILDSDNNIKEILSHSESSNTSLEEITKQANSILKENKTQVTKIGNLYFTSYSYNLSPGKTLTIIDNRPVRTKLLSSLKLALIIFFSLEIILIFLVKIITKWLIKPAQESFQKQRQFIADASHELKTPLSIIMASSEALDEDRSEDKWLENIKSEAVKMNNLISDLLDLAKLEETPKLENYQLLNLAKVIEKQVLTFEGLAYENNLKLDYQITPEIYFYANELQMQQLTSILIDNAFKHSYPKETITICLKKTSSEIILRVTNIGDVIPEEEQEKIFERFYRHDKARTRTDNRYGLGLAIALEIVNKHQGKIGVESKNKQTTFYVTFNLKKMNKKNNLKK